MVGRQAGGQVLNPCSGRQRVTAGVRGVERAEREEPKRNRAVMSLPSMERKPVGPWLGAFTGACPCCMPGLTTPTLQSAWNVTHSQPKSLRLPCSGSA